MTFKAEIQTSLGWNWNEGAVDNQRFEYAKQFPQGNGADQAEAVWHAEDQVLLSGASVTLDLTALQRVILGDTNTVAFLTVKAIWIVNKNTSGGHLLVGGAATDQWSEPFGADGHQIRVPLDSPLLLCNRKSGWPVDQTNRNLKLAAVDGNATYSLAILGTTSSTASSSSGT
jgi:hypothetical protein